MLRRQLHRRPEIVSHDIVTRAMHRSGADEFDGTGWTEALEVLTRSLDREANLHTVGRRRVRDELIDLVARRAAPVPPEDQRSPGILVTGLDPDDVAVVVDAWAGGPAAGRNRSCLRSTFASLDFETSWHLPTYAEWLAETDPTAALLDLARRSRTADGDADREVVGATQFMEHLPALRRAFPGALLVEVHRDPDAAAAVAALRAIEARRRDSDAVDEVKVERYWRWRTGMLADRRAAQGVGDGPVLDVDHGELTDPGAIARRIRAAISA